MATGQTDDAGCRPERVAERETVFRWNYTDRRWRLSICNLLDWELRPSSEPGLTFSVASMPRACPLGSTFAKSGRYHYHGPSLDQAKAALPFRPLLPPSVDALLERESEVEKSVRLRDAAIICVKQKLEEERAARRRDFQASIAGREE